MTSDRRAHLVGTTGAREERHRRLVLFTTAVLILLATSPVLVHHVGTQLQQLLAGHDHVWRLCVIALHELLSPVHTASHTLLVLGVVYACGDRLRAWLEMTRTLGVLDCARAVPHDAYWSAAARVGIPPETLRIVAGLPNPAFTAGWLRPRIYLAQQLADAIPAEQLDAVLAHEYAHVRRYDPARFTLFRFVGCALFWLPALRRLAADIVDDAEIAADDAAVRGQPLVLASAILALAAWRLPDGVGGVGTDALTSARSIVAGFHHDALLDRRIRRLAGEEPLVVSHVTRRSLASALAALTVVWLSGLAVAHPLPARLAGGSAHHVAAGTESARHCEHAHESALSHLFCIAGHEATSAERCPHELRQRATPS